MTGAGNRASGPSSSLDPVDVGVVIVTYNHEAEIGTLIDSLAGALEGLTWSAVVVDNDSTDATVAVVEKLGVTVLAMGRNSGYAAALNVGMAHFPQTRSILVSNPDIVLYPGGLLPAWDALAADGRVGIASPQLRSGTGRLGVTQRRDPTIRRLLAMTCLGSRIASRSIHMSDAITDPQAYLHSQDLDWAVGALMLVSRACVDAVGPWDESFFLYSEETDYCQRATAAGFIVRYVPVAAGEHEGGGGVHQPELRSMMAVNRVRLYSRHHPPVAAYAFFAVAVAFEASRALTGDRSARRATQALLRPSKRPIEIRCSESFLPR